MLSIPGPMGKLCDGFTRREFLRVGATGLFGLSLPQYFALKARAAGTPFDRAKAFGTAASVILCFLHGGPSHLDIWDPKPAAPSTIRREANTIKSSVDGVRLSETMPFLGTSASKSTS